MTRKSFNNILYLICTTVLIHANSLSDAFIDAAKIANPAVVSIIGKQDMESTLNRDPFYRHFRDFFEVPEDFGTSLGSGVIIDADSGYILTNNHVIKQADEITVILFDKREFIAELIGTDKLSDLALLKIDGDNLSDVTLGNSDKLNVGEWVVAIGSPFQQALSNTVTAGIVSAIGRSDIMSNRNIENFIQHDAAINPGNSGGALLNLDGELIGINTAIATGNSWSPQNAGIGFAIPINQAQRVIEDLVQFGSVSRGFLGVNIADIDEIMAKALGMNDLKGALVIQVVDESPAFNAGVKEQDVIIKVDNKDVPNAAKLKLLISSKHPDDNTRLTILRNKVRKVINVKLGTYPGEENLANKSSDSETDFDILGLIVINNDTAVKIKKIDEDSNAFKRGLRVGDIISKIDNNIISNKNDYIEILDNYKTGDVVMIKKIRSDGFPQFIAFEIN
tara:strand:+ start:3412 stop:4761 length:1350 start_codon:yes stop_codon:yes gene_type:complete